MTRGSPASEGLAAVAEAFERFATGLVRLEPCSPEELRRRVEAFVAGLERHLASPLPPSTTELVADHERFRESIAELRGLLAVLERDDHGGHRQALGQYGRLVTEALRRHLAEERRADRSSSPRAGQA